jgi:leucyl/phenylalanyl-tRNA--protein transferase
MIPWLQSDEPFPPAEAALRSPNGLLAASGTLDPDRLLLAYRRGIFPWFSEGDPVLWWSPDPRMVLFTDELRVSHSLRKLIRNVSRTQALQVRIDTAFESVMRACGEARPGQGGTWISEMMIDAYGRLHRSGYAHCVEVWRDDVLVGGLYGVAIGRAFFGESMFSRVRDASKLALAALVSLLRSEGVRMIDCQQRTSHLASLGAREIPRREFCSALRVAAAEAPIDWDRLARAMGNELLSGY